MLERYRNLSPKLQERIFALGAVGTTIVFVVAICVGVVGGVSGNPVLLGAGVGVAAVITCGCLVVRERNIAGY
jgi:hypothetical protein